MATYRYRRPPLFDYQIAALFNDSALSVCEACTKTGKTHGALAWLCEQAWLNGREGREFWWVAPSHDQARIAFNRMSRALKPVGPRNNKVEQSITLPNGAVIRFRTGEKPNLLFGEDVWAAVIDEAGRCRVEAYNAVVTTLTHTRGPLRMIGNVHGLSWFYDMCREVEKGERVGVYTRMTWEDGVRVGVIEKEQVDWARNNLTKAEFQQLYEAVLPEDAQMFRPGALVLREPDETWTRERTVRYWDLASTPEDPAKDPDWTVGLRMARWKDSDGLLWYNIEDIQRMRKAPDGVMESIIETAEADGEDVLIRVEEEPGSAGKHVVASIRRQLREVGGFGVGGDKVTGPKIERARGASMAWGAGSMIASPDAPWLEELKREAGQFPQGAHDDQIDALSGAFRDVIKQGVRVYASN